MFPRLRALFSTKSNPVARSVWLHITGQTQWPDRKYDTRAREGYMGNATVFACVHQTAMACAGIPWLLFQRKKGQGTKNQEVEDHPLLDILSKPSGTSAMKIAQAQFIETHIAFLLLDGNGFIHANGPTGDAVGPRRNRRAPQPTELWNLRPDRITIEPDGRDDVKEYVYLKNNTGEAHFTPEQVLHRRFFHPLDDFRGLSPMQVAARDADQDNAARRWNYNLALQSGRISGAFVSEKTLGDRQREQLRSVIDEEISGPESAGKIILLEGGLDWKEMALSMKDADWTSGRWMSMLDICKAFGMPPELIGATEHKIYNNYREARKAFYEQSILGLMDGLRDDLNNWLVPRWDDNLFLEYDRDTIEALQETQDALHQRARDAWWITLNEKRVMTGWDEIPGGDVLAIPAGMVLLPMDAIGDALTDPGDPEDPGDEGNF